jgi:hypothetical protein
MFYFFYFFISLQRALRHTFMDIITLYNGITNKS